MLVRGGRVGGAPTDLLLHRGRIAARGPGLRAPRGARVLTLHGELLLPGLVNGHDHLHLDSLPHTGAGPYADAEDWAASFDVRLRPTLADRLSVPLDDRLRWGGLKNLLAGATWVGHHDADFPGLRAADFPVRVPRRYAHVTSLHRGGDVGRAVRALAGRGPFFIHLAEGTDARARGETDALAARGGLGPSTVAVHGVGLRAADRARLEQAGAALVVCPSSNRFLLGALPAIDGLSRVLVGTDSTLTGAPSLLDELRVAQAQLGMGWARLWAAQTTLGAAVLRLPLGAGTLDVGAPAHVLAARSDAPDGARALGALRPRDLSVVWVDGEVRAAAGEHGQTDPALRRIQVEGEARWVRAADAAAVARVTQEGRGAPPGWFHGWGAEFSVG
jgi:cytosine/adenosine deaminase-related metal-dependent hydrolase